MRRLFSQNGVMTVVATILFTWTCASASMDKPEVFVLTLSLLSPTMHVGDDLIFDVNTSNPTDHVLFAAEGGKGGLAVELLNPKGEDVGIYAMGIRSGKIEEPPAYLAPTKTILRPNSKHDFTWRLKPVPGYFGTRNV